MDKEPNESQLTSSLDVLWNNVKSFRDSRNYSRLMKACATYRHLAPYNAMLVALQRPGARYMLTEMDWLKRYNRGFGHHS